MTDILILGAIAAAGLVVGSLVGYGVGWWYRGLQDHADLFADYVDVTSDGTGTHVDFEAPSVGSGFFSLFSYIRHRSKAKRLARKGYVKWYKFDGGMLHGPQWVKPERDGAGVPEYYDSDDDQTYLFPNDPLVTDAETGARVAVHHTGQVEPVNIANPSHPPIDADRLDEIINLEIESEPPGWLDNFDLDSTTMMYGAIVLILVLGAAQQYLV